VIQGFDLRITLRQTQGDLEFFCESRYNYLKIPQHILKDVADELKKSSDKEHQHQVSEGVRLQQQYQTLQTRIKRARELYLDASIAKEEFDEMMTGLQVERQNIEARLQRLSNADNGFKGI
jgi:hypothetical protein